METTTLAHQLMAQKDAIEAEIVEQDKVLQRQGVGMHQPLVDLSGFPRDDLDLMAVRTARARIIALRNDHKDIMLQIEQALHSIHADARAQKKAQEEEEARRRAETGESADVSISPIQVFQSDAFAIVNAIHPDSPAKEAGLLKDDKIVRFGTVHAGNHEKLRALNSIVAQNEGSTIDVTIERASDQERPSTLVLQLIPRRGWGGPGLLGCHILPI